MLGIQPDDVVMVAKAGNAVRIVLERGDLYLSDGRVMFTLYGCRSRKDGLPGKRSEVFFFDIEARERDR